MTTYRNDLDALTARHSALSSEVAHKARELDTTSRLLDEAKEKARLPVLPNIRVATPCTADWKAMTPVLGEGDGDRVRACGECSKNVYNLSEMTRDEAEALIMAKQGKLCVRYFQRKDGTIILKDCTIGVAQKRRRRVIAAGAAALLAGGAAAAWLLRSKAQADAPRSSLSDHHEVLMGPPPPPEPQHDPSPPESQHDLVEIKGGVGAPSHLVEQAHVHIKPKHAK